MAFRLPSIEFFAASLMLLLTARAMGQSAAVWPLAPEQMTLDFCSENRARRVTFDKDGVTLEIDVQVLMVGRDHVSIETVLPEAGDVQMEVVDGSHVTLVPHDARGATGRAELVSSLKAVSPKELSIRVQGETDALLQPALELGLKEAQKLGKEKLATYLKRHDYAVPKDEQELAATFARLWVEKNATQGIRDELQKVVDKYPGWLSDHEKRGSLSLTELLLRFSELRAGELADEHLIQCGCNLKKNDRGFRDRLKPRFEAVYLAMTGKGAEKTSTGAPVTAVLSSSDLKKLRRSLTAELKCRFTFSADPDDANAQWFNAQRIACRATGPVVQVEGRLTPDDHDRVDWWRFDRWKQGQMILDLPKLTAVRWEQYPIDGALLLRVVATQQEPTVYNFVLRPAGKAAADSAITIFETSPPGSPKFPY